MTERNLSVVIDTKLKSADPFARLAENFRRSLGDLETRLDRLRKKTDEMASGRGLVNEAARDFFGIGRADKQLERLKSNLSVTLRQLENKSLKMKIDGDPTPLLRTLQRAENQVRQMQGAMREQLKATQASFSRAAGGAMDLGRGLSLLSNGSDAMDKLVTKAIQLDALFGVMRGAKDTFAGIVGGIRNASTAMNMFGAARGAQAQIGSAAAAISGRLGGGAVASAAGGAGASLLTGGATAAAGGGVGAGGVAMGGAAAAVASTALIALPFVVAAGIAFMGARPDLIVKATKNIPILDRIFGSRGVAESEAALARIQSNRQIAHLARQAEFEGQSARLPFLQEQASLRERIGAARDIGIGASIQGAGTIESMRYARLVEQYQRAQGYAAAPAGGVAGAGPAGERAFARAEYRTAEERLRREFEGQQTGNPAARAGLQAANARLARARQEHAAAQAEAARAGAAGAGPRAAQDHLAAQRNVNELAQAMRHVQYLQQHRVSATASYDVANAGESRWFIGAAENEGRRHAAAELRRLAGGNAQVAAALRGENGQLRFDQAAAAQLSFSHANAATSRDVNALSAQQQAQHQDRTAQTAEQVAAATQQQLQATRELREAEIGRLQNYQQLVRSARDMAQQQARSYRAETQSSRESIAGTDIMSQQRLLGIARTIHAGGGANLPDEELQFARGFSAFQDPIRQIMNERANRTGLPDEIHSLLGRPQEQAARDQDAGRLQNIEVRIQNRVEVLTRENAQQVSREVNDRLVPVLENMSRDVGNRMATAVATAMAKALERFEQRLTEIQANQRPNG